MSRAAGMRLARELPATGPVPLLQAGAELTRSFCDALRTQGIYAVWVSDELSEGIEPHALLPDDVRRQATATMHEAVEAAGEAFRRGRSLPDDVLQELRGVAARIVDAVGGEPSTALALVELADAHERVHQHSVNVCALGVRLGHTLFRRSGWIDWDGRRRRDRIEERLVTLGIGLLLHDIGKVTLPARLVARREGLTAKEAALVREHPAAALALLRTDAVSLVVKAIIRDHHERWDGRGYPRGVARGEINPLARIAAVANLYDNVTMPLGDQPGASPHEAVRAVRREAGQALDPEVVEVFRRIVFPYPVGTEVEVEQGIVGVVASVDPNSPDTPVVRFRGPEGPLELPVDTTKRPVRVLRSAA